MMHIIALITNGLLLLLSSIWLAIEEAQFHKKLGMLFGVINVIMVLGLLMHTYVNVISSS